MTAGERQETDSVCSSVARATDLQGWGGGWVHKLTGMYGIIMAFFVITYVPHQKPAMVIVDIGLYRKKDQKDAASIPTDDLIPQLGAEESITH